MTAEASGPRRYAKPIALPDRLDLLKGPTSGIVRLPRHLKWSGNPVYDLSAPGRIVDLYRTVLNEALSAADLNAYLNEVALKGLWSKMWLPPHIRRMWEERFPELADSRASSTRSR